MDLFLVEGQLESNAFSGLSKTEKVSRLVKAEDEEQAEAKFTEHFEKESDQYHVTYTVHGATAHAVIE